MRQSKPSPRRVPYTNPQGRREPGIYTRTSAGGAPTFEIGWRDSQGRQRWRRVEGGIKTARAALAEAHSQRARGERVAADPRLRFDAAADAWWEARVLKLRPATQSAYGASLRHVREHFGASRLGDITPSDVARFVTRQQSAGMKGWTIKGQVGAIRAVFNYASRHMGFVGANPVALLDRTERPSSDDERAKRVLSPDELRRLIDAVEDRHRLVFEVAAETGARLGEVLGLTWGCVDVPAAAVQFTQQLDRTGQLVPLKTKRSRRWVEVTPSLASTLREHRVASSRSSVHDFVFVTGRGTPHDHRNIAGRVLARAVERAGLGDVTRDGRVVEHAPTFHSLRHSHASALIADGWDIEEVSSRLGHADTAITQRTYVHAFDAARRSDDRRRRLANLYGVEAGVEATGHSGAQHPAAADPPKVLPLGR